ncbi:MAG: peptidoglycan DD-metalloendopeptidase family protein, partial [Alphaproteobacteria bacterium]|nr:peptidoglycan DD-metalloendopeptidase family protein [Alphaproteobacteria bacterium]
LSKRYNIQMRDLIDANHLVPPYTLRIGQVLRVPTSNYHVVSKGDTLYSISRRYGVDVKTLAANNDLYPPYTLIIGQRVAINGKNSGGGSYYTSSYASTQPTTSYSSTSSTKQTQQISTAKTSAPVAQVSKTRKTKFAWPVRGEIVSKYGTIGKGRANDGINIKAARGTTVKAADGGTVAYAGNELKGFGNLILIKHSDGWITAYAHNDKLLVKKGQKIIKGEKIATVGTTGGVNVPQLHFEVRAGKNPVNPILYLP